MATILTNKSQDARLDRIERILENLSDVVGYQVSHNKPQAAVVPTGYTIMPSFADVVAKVDTKVASAMAVKYADLPKPELRKANTRAVALEYLSHLKPQHWAMKDENGNPIVDGNGKQRFGAQRHFLKKFYEAQILEGKMPIREDGVILYTPKSGDNAGKLTEYSLTCKVTHLNQNGAIVPNFEYGFQQVKKI